MTHRPLHLSLGLFTLVSWSASAHALDFVLSGAIEQSAHSSRVEVFATLSVPLSEWATPVSILARTMNERPTYQRAWNALERQEEQERWALGEDEWFLGLDAGNSEAVGRGEVLGQSEQASETPSAASPSSSAMPLSKPPSLDPVAPPVFNDTFIQGFMRACTREFGSAGAVLDNLSDRARWSAWLPDVQLRGGRSTDQTLRLTTTEADPGRYQVVGGDGVRYEGQVRWSFSQLVFARDELAVARLRGTLDSEKRKRQHHAMDTLGKWFTAWMTSASAGAEPSSRRKAWVTERTLRAELDWLSRGWFSTQVPPSIDLADISLAELE